MPFGVRALESGIEVDGVWISRPNTPASSLPASPTLSGIMQPAAQPDVSPGKGSSSSDMSSVEVPQPFHGNPDVNSPSDSSSSGRNVLGRPARQHQQPPTSDHQPRGRATYQPRRSSHLRFSNSFNPEDPEAFAALEGRPMMTEKDGKRPEGKPTSCFSKRQELLLKVLGTAPDPNFEGRRTSSSLSGSSSNSENEASGHKLPTGASSNGFLYPEYHIPGKGRTQTYELHDLDAGPQDQRSSVHGKSQPHLPGLRSKRTAILGASDNGIRSDSASSPHEGSDPLGTPSGFIGDGNIPVFHEVEDMANQYTHLIDANEINYDQGHAQPLRPFDGNRQTRNSQILRKVNSNFQILRPGTLDPPRHSNDFSSWRVDLEAGSKRDSKRLQKRGRASSKSSYTIGK